MNFVKSKKNVKGLLVVTLLLISIVFSACNGSEGNTQTTPVITTTIAATTTPVDSERIALGEGENSFFLDISFNDSEKLYSISTNKETVGDALLELNLIEGDVGEYGLYITSVDGVVADYNTDGSYWAFFVNDEYAVSGVDSTEIENGITYKLKKTNE